MTSRENTHAQPSVQQLGVVQREYKTSSGGLIALAVFFLVVVLVVLVVAADGNTGIFLPGGLVACLVFAGILALILTRGRLSVTQYENGLAVYRKKELFAVVPWDHVTHVQQAITRYRTNGVPSGTSYRYFIRTSDGHSFRFTNSLKHIKELGERIQQATFPFILARNLAAFNAGQPVQFGALSVSQAGLSTKGSSIPWSEVSGARIANGQIHIQKAGRWLNWAKLQVAQTPDALVLIALLNQLTSVRTR